MLELICTTAIIAALMAIIIPAVSSARATASRAACSVNMKQLTLAAQNFESLTRQMTPSPTEFHATILPYMEQAAMAEVDSAEGYVGSSPEVYVCTSDERASRTDQNISYLLNAGSPVGKTVESGYNGIVGDITTGYAGLPRSYVTDGSSNTAFLSEKLVALRKRDVFTEFGSPTLPEVTNEIESRWQVNLKSPVDTLTSTYDFAQECLEGDRITSYKFEGFVHSKEQRSASSGYDHTQPPNSPNCGANVTHNGALFKSFPASSRHPGGVNVAMADGRVTFASDAIDFDVWQALGTRSGGELGTQF